MPSKIALACSYLCPTHAETFFLLTYHLVSRAGFTSPALGSSFPSSALLAPSLPIHLSLGSSLHVPRPGIHSTCDFCYLWIMTCGFSITFSLLLNSHFQLANFFTKTPLTRTDLSIFSFTTASRRHSPRVKCPSFVSATFFNSSHAANGVYFAFFLKFFFLLPSSLWPLLKKEAPKQEKKKQVFPKHSQRMKVKGHMWFIIWTWNLSHEREKRNDEECWKERKSERFAGKHTQADKEREGERGRGRESHIKQDTTGHWGRSFLSFASCTKKVVAKKVTADCRVSV